jgi:hypothetical protein
MALPKFLEDYTTVDELISKMNKEYPECRLVAEMVDNGDDWVIFKSSFYENKEDTEPKATGYARQTKADHNSWFEMASTKANGRCLRVVFSESTTAEEMIGIAPSKEAAPKKSIEKELDKAGIEFEDVSVSQISCYKQHEKSFAMDLASENKTNAANWYAQALGELGINEKQLDINNMQTVKNKIQDIATELQVGGA